VLSQTLLRNKELFRSKIENRWQGIANTFFIPRIQFFRQ
jgi:hypothetical protein